jgi:glutathione peroxidase
MSIYAVETKTLEGEPTSLERYAGKVTLLVNVASACGYTPQYSGLQRLHEKYRDRGFSVLGFPSNDFGAQEPGSAGEIREFCSTQFRVDFPMFEKGQTRPGPAQSSVYAALERAAGKLPSWNFGKYLIGRNGQVVEFFPSSVDPEDPALVSAVEAALAENA